MAGIASLGYTPGDNWHQVPLGGGGFVTRISTSSDGTTICSTDTAGAYKWIPSAAKWSRLDTTQSLPNGFQTFGANNGGVYEADISPSNSLFIYMMLNGYVFQSIDGGSTFSRMATFNGGNQVSPATVYCNGGTARLNGHKIAVDPSNANCAIVGTGFNGISIWNGSAWSSLNVPSSPPLTFTVSGATTSNGTVSTLAFVGLSSAPASGDAVFDSSNLAQSAIASGVTVTAGATTTAVPLSAPVTVTSGDTIGFGITTNGSLTWAGYSVCFDYTQAAVGGFTQGIYICSWGSVPYTSSNGGSTFSAMVGGPTNVVYSTMAPDGTFWAVSQSSDWAGTNSNLWKWTTGSPGAWTRYTKTQTGANNPIKAISFDRHTYTATSGATLPAAIFTTSGLQLVYTPNWFGTTPLLYTAPPSISWDASWLSARTQPSFGWIEADPSQSNVFWVGHGDGVMYGSPPSTNTAFSWTGVANGVENLATYRLRRTPGAVGPIATCQDQGFFVLNPFGNPAQTSNWIPSSATLVGNQLIDGGNIEYASSDPSFICVPCAESSTTNACAAYSRDYGKTWTFFPQQVSAYQGCFAAASPTKIVWVPCTTGGVDGIPWFSSDGTTFAKITAIPQTGAGYLGGQFNKSEPACADRDYQNAPNTFYIYYYNTSDAGNEGIWFNNDGTGVTWSQIYTGVIPHTIGAGACRLASIPGEPRGTLLYCGSPNQGTNGTIQISSTNWGTSPPTMTWNNFCALLTSVQSYGFGMAKPGSNHTSVYVIGTYNGTPAIWQFTNLGDINSEVPVNISGILPGPGPNIIQPSDIDGDMGVYGRLYVSVNGNSYYYRNFVSG